MDLFKTDLLRLHPPQRSADRLTYRGRRGRFGCRSVPPRPTALPLAAAVRQALAAPPIHPAQEAAESTAEAA